MWREAGFDVAHMYKFGANVENRAKVNHVRIDGIHYKPWVHAPAMTLEILSQVYEKHLANREGGSSAAARSFVLPSVSPISTRSPAATPSATVGAQPSGSSTASPPPPPAAPSTATSSASPAGVSIVSGSPSAAATTPLATASSSTSAKPSVLVAASSSASSSPIAAGPAGSRTSSSDPKPEQIIDKAAEEVDREDAHGVVVGEEEGGGHVEDGAFTSWLSLPTTQRVWETEWWDLCLTASSLCIIVAATVVVQRRRWRHGSGGYQPVVSAAPSTSAGAAAAGAAGGSSQI